MNYFVVNFASWIFIENRKKKKHVFSWDRYNIHLTKYSFPNLESSKAAELQQSRRDSRLLPQIHSWLHRPICVLPLTLLGSCELLLTNGNRANRRAFASTVTFRKKATSVSLINFFPFLPLRKQTAKLWATWEVAWLRSLGSIQPTKRSGP